MSRDVNIDENGNIRLSIQLPQAEWSDPIETLNVNITSEGIIFDLYSTTERGDRLVGTSGNTFEEWGDSLREY